MVYANGKLPVTNGYSYWEVTVADGADDELRQSKLHPHPVARHNVDNGWGCDGHSAPGSGCGRGMGNTSGVGRFRCALGCDFDLCVDCVRAVSFLFLSFSLSFSLGSADAQTQTHMNESAPHTFVYSLLRHVSNALSACTSGDGFLDIWRRVRYVQDRVRTQDGQERLEVASRHGAFESDYDDMLCH